MDIDYDKLAEAIEKRKGKRGGKQPFTITCNRCGGHNVEVFAYEFRDLGIICKDCNADAGDIGFYESH